MKQFCAIAKALSAVSRVAAFVCAFGVSTLFAGEAGGTLPEPGGVKPPPPKVNESDLQRVKVAPARILPWIGKPAVAKPATGTPSKDKPAAAASESPIDLNSGEMIMRFFGPFTREERKSNPDLKDPDKEAITMTKKVEIEMLQSQSVLRGETIVVIRDIKSQDTEMIVATSDVQLVTPDRKGKGEKLVFETKKGPNGEILENKFILIGDLANGGKATLWMNKDVIQASRFERDERLDTFRANGAPVAVVTLPGDASPPAAAGSAGSGLGGLNLSGGGKISLQCEADMLFEGATGKLTLKRNPIIVKEGLNPGEGVKMWADNAEITLDMPPPGMPPNPSAGMLSGEMKTLVCMGNVEIKSGTRTIHCDKLTVDMQKKTLFMESPTDTVKVYNQSRPTEGEAMLAPKSLKMNMDTQELEAGGPMKTKAFTGQAPSNRGPKPDAADTKPADPKKGK